MRNKQSGTQKWCPQFESLRVVKSVPPASLGEIPHQRVYKTKYEDLKLFRRGQECQTCWHTWLSAEVHEDFINELVKLRDDLRDIKKNAETHSKGLEYGSLRLISGD